MSGSVTRMEDPPAGVDGCIMIGGLDVEYGKGRDKGSEDGRGFDKDTRGEVIVDVVV